MVPHGRERWGNNMGEQHLGKWERKLWSLSTNKTLGVRILCGLPNCCRSLVVPNFSHAHLARMRVAAGRTARFFHHSVVIHFLRIDATIVLMGSIAGDIKGVVAACFLALVVCQSPQEFFFLLGQRVGRHNVAPLMHKLMDVVGCALDGVGGDDGQGQQQHCRQHREMAGAGWHGEDAVIRRVSDVGELMRYNKRGNQTSHHLLLGEKDWVPQHLPMGAHRSVSTLAPLIHIFLLPGRRWHPVAPMEVAGTLSKKFRKGIFFYFIFSLKIYLPKTFLLFFFTLISAPTNHTVLLAMPPRPYHCAMLGAVLLLALAVIAPHTVQGTSYNVHQFLDKRCRHVRPAPHNIDPTDPGELARRTSSEEKCMKSCRKYAYGTIWNRPAAYDPCGIKAEEKKEQQKGNRIDDSTGRKRVVNKACKSVCFHQHACEQCMAAIWDSKQPGCCLQ